MTDSSLDQELDRSERQFAAADARRAFEAQPLRPVRKGRLSAEEAAARREAAIRTPESTAVVATVPVRPVPPADPSVTLRHARIGLFAALTLVLLLVWIMQRRKGKD